MESCPDCIQAKQLYGNNPDYEIVDIGKQARDLKEFLVLRNNRNPCFVKDEGEVVISMKHNLVSSETAPSEPEYAAGAACNLDGTGC